MPTYWAHQVWLVFGCILTDGSFAMPRVAFPINSQVPPVAYVAKPFEFTFAPTTFESDSSKIAYTLSNQPSWLSIDGSTNRLMGTPTLGDVGAPVFEIVASDLEGRVASSVTLVVRENQTIYPSQNGILPELASGGSVSAPSTLLLHPQRAFEFPLTDVFAGVSAETVYYGLSSDGSPLPSWLQFDKGELRFSGTSPPLLASNPSEQTYFFTLAASNVAGFTEASISFDILVSDHVLAFITPAFNTTTSGNVSLQIPGLLSQLTFDGTAARRDQIASASAIRPQWVDFNDDDFSFSGNVPADAESFKIILTVQGLEANAVNTTISIDLKNQNTSQLTFATVTAIGGTYFTYTIPVPSNMSSDTRISVDTSGIADWLVFIAANRTLHGLVPDRVAPAVRNIPVSLTSMSQTITTILTLFINPAITASSTTATTAAATTSASQEDVKPTGRKLVTIILAIMLPILVISLVIAAVLIWLRRREKLRETSNNKERSKQVQQTAQDPELRFDDDLSMPGSTVPYENTQAVNSAPQVNLPWAPDSLKRIRSRWSRKPRAVRGKAVDSNWDDPVDLRVHPNERSSSTSLGIFKPQQKPNATLPSRSTSLQAPRGRPKESENSSAQHPQQIHRKSEPLNLSTMPGANLPSRLSGAGHGTGRACGSVDPNLRSSWQTTAATNPTVNSGANIGLPRSSPRLPPESSSSVVKGLKGVSPRHSRSNQSVLRLAESSGGGSQSLEEARHKYYTQKARYQLEGTTNLSSLLSDTGERSEIPITKAQRGKSLDKAVDNRVFKTPPLPQRSQARPGPGQVWTTRTRQSNPGDRSMLQRELSVASSHQFDSAVSSDSQWEDDNLVVDENAGGEIIWQTRASSANYRPTPRLPFKPYSERERYVDEGQAGSGSGRARLADQRKQVGIGEPELHRSEKSQRGSLRFI